MPNVRLNLQRDEVARELGIELPEPLTSDARPWHSVVCSRLGRNLISKRASIAVARRFVEVANLRGDRTLVVRDTAAHPWTDRACELLGFEPVRVANSDAADPWVLIDIASFCRDKLAIELADRVDATFVRPGGKIMRLLCDRLERDPAAQVQVLVTSASDQAAKELIARGAIGYWLNLEPQNKVASSENLVPIDHDATTRSGRGSSFVQSLIQHPERWLIHSTRERTGPWPGQSLQQFKDWLLLSEPFSEPSSPLETLRRIVHEKRLVGSHRTTSSSTPVVCFTALPILEWLSHRKFRPHLNRWDAEPYGVAINRSFAERMGIQSVVYGGKETLASLDKEHRWRFQAAGTTYDWRSEQEYRGLGTIDLSGFATGDVVVFVNNDEDVRCLHPLPWPIVPVSSLHRLSNSIA